jgi:hypothetical protein
MIFLIVLLVLHFVLAYAVKINSDNYLIVSIANIIVLLIGYKVADGYFSHFAAYHPWMIFVVVVGLATLAGMYFMKNVRQLQG